VGGTLVDVGADAGGMETGGWVGCVATIGCVATTACGAMTPDVLLKLHAGRSDVQISARRSEKRDVYQFTSVLQSQI
jgi:hypothetical protein